MLISEALKWGEKQLSSLAISNPQMEALWMLSATSSIERSEIFLKRGILLSRTKAIKYKERIRQRLNGFPLPYILGSQEFMGLSFQVNENTLIPRQETELIVEESVRRLQKISNPRIVEIGSGTGNISVSIAKNIPSVKIVSIELSRSALKVAKRNAEMNGVEEAITFLEGDLFSPLLSDSGISCSFDLVVSNPPYIRSRVLDRLQKEIQFEPRVALDGGANGLKVIQPLIERARKYLKKNGALLIEIGFDQSKIAGELMKSFGYQNIKKIQDYSGIDRVVVGNL